MHRGIDVSNVNGHVAWGRVASAGISFAFAKATEGLTFTDGLFAENRASAHSFGIPLGAYHFGRPDSHPGTAGAIAEAKHFASVVGKVRPGELRPVLDLETGSGALTAWAGAFLAEVERLLGVRPILYSYTSFIQSHLNLRSLAGHPLWVADYGPNDGREHPTSLASAAIHQFTSNGSVSGVSGRVDLNSAASLAPLQVGAPKPAPLPAPLPHPRPKPKPKPVRRIVHKAWPVPLPAWFWAWAQWRQDGQSYARPANAPKVIPGWAWLRLRAL